MNTDCSRTFSDVVRVCNSDSLRKIYAFRYDIYVVEMNRKQSYVDHEKRLIYDPLDESGFVFAAFDEFDEIVGTVRVNCFRDNTPSLIEYAQLYRIDDFPLQQCSLNTRLMIRSDHRNGRMLTELVIAAYRCSLENGMKHNFMDCNDPLPLVAKRYGYVLHGKAQHNDYGKVSVMRLDLHRRDQLEKVESPLECVLDDYEAAIKSAETL